MSNLPVKENEPVANADQAEANTSSSPPVPTSTPATPKQKRQYLAVLLILAVIIPPGLLVLWLFEPTENSWFPKCFFFQTTRLHCPGCGATRALHAFLNGNFAQAFAYNVPVFLFYPVLLVWFLVNCFFVFTNRPLPRKRLPAWFIMCIFWMFLGYWILRNIPFPPFDLLAPHEIGP